MSGKRTNELSQKEAQEWYFYDPDTGKLHWKMRPSRNSNVTWGDEAGYVNSNGYILVGLQGRSCYAHNIIWSFHYGNIPDEMTVDHIDKDKTNNRIENLRLANNRQQMINQNVRGFCWRKDRKKWQARHRAASKSEHLGLFTTALQARLAYERATFELEPEFSSSWLTDALRHLCSEGSPTVWVPS